MKTFNISVKLGIVCAAAILIFASSCKNETGPFPNPVNMEETDGPDVNFFALTSDNRLLTLNAKAVATVIAAVPVTGLQAGETILGMDFRPATGQLYAIGSTSRLYIINTATGAARAVNAAPFTPAITASIYGAGFDFNPTVDRIRYIGYNGQNLRLHPETGAVAFTDGSISGSTLAPGVSAAAYTENRAGATSTILYDIDLNNDKLYKQDPPNDGKLVEVGSLTVNAEATGGFDISPDGSKALAILTVESKKALYTIDLTTGKAVRIKGDLPASIIGFAIPTEPVAYAVTTNTELAIFNPASPAPVLKAISGLQAGETILGIDMRPVNGQLFALGSTSRLYTLNASSGAATQVGTGTLTTPLLGTDFGFDFNPTVDRIRVVSNLGQNLRLNPNDGTVAAVDGTINPITSSVSASAYTNNFAGATATVLYNIDAGAGRLVKQDPPNNGTLSDVGALGVTASTANGFDIGSTSGTAYAVLIVGGVTKIYTINLTTGAATAGATLNGNYTGFTLGLGF
ncbi:DUF4394 domain-containing protein [Mucilaginibacter pedocola]|uniref:DUF4394 domain-containing protein n=1 Tax=Mucilaginibacter pedocola TaxID=1792845 RepID=A0A1S9PFH3_9SPHI|nr:DUF4394 domain-containing protein [Mucilaginibacter pedocola]OOQ59715.1 hypothetical protein BC343_05995 [Mucilaginibacter pedocola]